MRRMLPRLVLALVALSALLVAPVPTDAQGNPCVMVNLHPNQNNLPAATSGQGYTQNFWITPSNPCIPVIWTINPAPPPSLTFGSTSQTQAQLTGTPNAPGTYIFTVTAQCTFICGTVCFLSDTYTLVIN